MLDAIANMSPDAGVCFGFIALFLFVFFVWFPSYILWEQWYYWNDEEHWKSTI